MKSTKIVVMCCSMSPTLCNGICRLVWNAICFKIAVVSGALQINLGGAMNEARGAVNVWRGDKFFWWGDNFSGRGITSLGGRYYFSREFIASSP